MQRRLITVPEAAEYLSLSVSLIYKLAESRKIPSVKIGSKLLFDLIRLDRFIEENSFEIRDWSGKQ